MKIEEEIKTIRELARPLCEFLKENHTKNSKLVITQNFIKLIDEEDVRGIPINVN